MSHSIIQPTFVRLAMVLLALIAPRALAQDADESPDRILQASRDAIAEIDGFMAQFRMKGEGGSMFAETMPSMNGQIFFGEHDEHGSVIRTIGESKDKQKDPPKVLDQLIANDRFIWLDMDARTITEAPNRSNMRGLPSSLNLVLLRSMINEDPYEQDVSGAVSVTLGAREMVAGEICDQIVIKRPKPEGGIRGSSQAYTDVIWWISAEDRLPRKVHQITDAGMVKIVLSFELSNLRIIDPDQDQLEVRRPQGFEFVSRMPKPREENKDTPVRAEPDPRDRPVETERPTRSDEPEATPPTASIPMAPTFAFTTTDGDSVDNSTQRGKVTLLYFMGSWCVPCVETSPLVGTIRSEIDNEAFDVYALSIREGDPQRAERNFSAEHPQLAMSVNPDSISADFKVRVFPTLVVIDRDGSIAFQRSIGKDYGAEKLADEAREAIDELLTGA